MSQMFIARTSPGRTTNEIDPHPALDPKYLKIVDTPHPSSTLHGIRIPAMHSHSIQNEHTHTHAHTMLSPPPPPLLNC